MLTRVKRHYDRVERGARRSPDGYRSRGATPTPSSCSSGRCTGPTLAALTYAKSLAPDRLVALSVVSDADERRAHPGSSGSASTSTCRCRSLSSPYRELTGPVLSYLDELDAEYDNDIITVILPEFVLTKWWEQLLHNQSALVLKGRLLFRRNTVVVSVPYHIDGGEVAVPAVMEAPRPSDPGEGS